MCVIRYSSKMFTPRLTAWLSFLVTFLVTSNGNHSNCAPTTAAALPHPRHASVCKQLETGKMDVDAIGFYGGRDGTNNFLLVTMDGHVWDHSGSVFDHYHMKATLQEWSVNTVDYKWPNLRNHYRPDLKRIDGAILRDKSEDWLIFMTEQGVALNQSLTDQFKPVTYPKIKFVGTEDYKLVSSVPAKKPFVIGNASFLLNQELCLYQFSINVEKSGILFWSSKIQLAASNWQTPKCASSKDSRPVDRAFMDINGLLYGVDNKNQKIYVYHTGSESKLELTIEFTFDQFFDCGSFHKWILITIGTFVLVVGVVCISYFFPGVIKSYLLCIFECFCCIEGDQRKNDADLLKIEGKTVDTQTPTTTASAATPTTSTQPVAQPTTTSVPPTQATPSLATPSSAQGSGVSSHAPSAMATTSKGLSQTPHGMPHSPPLLSAKSLRSKTYKSKSPSAIELNPGPPAPKS